MSKITFDTNDIERAWIQTASGGKFHILDPRPEEIDIEDIAHSLGKLCRFTGHCRKLYSVAEHCVHCSYLVSPENALCALLHDASEAYLADMNRPLKHFTPAGDSYRQVEKIVSDAIYKKFGLSLEEPEEIKAADNTMLYFEKDELMWPLAWDQKWGSVSVEKPNIQLKCWDDKVAKAVYLYRFYELTKRL